MSKINVQYVRLMYNKSQTQWTTQDIAIDEFDLFYLTSLGTDKLIYYTFSILCKGCILLTHFAEGSLR